jgi:hypothetical protein
MLGDKMGEQLFDNREYVVTSIRYEQIEAGEAELALQGLEACKNADQPSLFPEL